MSALILLWCVVLEELRVHLAKHRIFSCAIMNGVFSFILPGLVLLDAVTAARLPPSGSVETGKLMFL